MEQKQLAKLFLEALFALDEIQRDTKRLYRSLETLSAVVERDMPLNERIADRLLIGLTVNYRHYSRRPTNELMVISNGQESEGAVEQHLLVLFTQVVGSTIIKYRQLLSLKDNDCLVVLLDSCLEMVPTKQKELLLEVLGLVDVLVRAIVSSSPERADKVFPKSLSVLFKLVLNQQAETKSVKAKQRALQIATELLCNSFRREVQQPMVLSNPLAVRDREEPPADHVKRYLQALSNNLETLGLQEKHAQIKELVRRVLECPGSHQPQLLPVLYGLAFNVGFLPDISSESEYHQSVISEWMRDETHRQLAHLASKNMLSSSEQLKRLQFLGRVLSTSLQFPYEQSSRMLTHLLAALRTDINPKVRLTLNSTVLPLERLTGQSKLEPTLESSLLTSFRSVRETALLNTFRLFQSEAELLRSFELLVDGASASVIQHWSEQMAERLQQLSYDLQMSLRQLSEYLALVYLLSLVSRHKLNNSRHLRDVYSTLRKSQPLKELNISHEEEELLVVLSLETVASCYEKSNNQALKKMEGFNYRLTMTEVLLGLSDQEVYSVTLLSHLLLLRLCQGQSVAEYLVPQVPTLLHRNPRHLKLLTTLIRYTASSIPKGLAEQIASDYYLLRDTEEMIMLLVPRLSTNLARRCLLAMSDESRWVEALMSCAQHLSKQPMVNELNEGLTAQPFYANDQQNSSVSDCLGVVLLELGTDRWRIELQGRRCSRILDLLLRLFDLNPHAIFFRNLFELFPVMQQQLERLRDSVASHGLALVAEKIVRLLRQYFLDSRLKLIKVKSQVVADLSVSLELLVSKIKLELYTAQTADDDRSKALVRIRDSGESLIELICQASDAQSKQPDLPSGE